MSLGQRIADPRVLSDELDASEDGHPDIYSGLASYTFGSLSPNDPAPEPDSISPLSLPRLSPDRTPRPSVSTQTPFQLLVSSHPSQGPGRPVSSHHLSDSSSSRHSYAWDSVAGPSASRSPAMSGSDSERSEDSTPSTDPIAAFYSSQRDRLMSDTASQHTFGRASRTHGFTAASSHDGAFPSSSSVSVVTSRSSSRTSMRTMEQFSSEDELDLDYYDDDGGSSPVTFARYDLADIDEDEDLVDTRPPSIRSFIPDRRRGSLPMAIPGAVQLSDAYSVRSREGSILTVRRPSRSWDDTSTHRSSHSAEDPTLILPKSEPLSRADWLSVEAQLQARQQQEQQQQEQVDLPTVYEGFDVKYILSERLESGSIRSSNSRLSFVQGTPVHRRSSPHIFRASGSTTTLPFEDSFMRHLQKHDRTFDSEHYLWSFQRERADASTSSSRRRQQAQLHKSGKESGPRVQEMWRCGHVGRFKVDKLVFKPDSAKGTQQRIHVRHIPDPFLGNTTSGPHSVIHKHSRAVAFSIFRSHNLFSNRQPGPNTQTHMNMRLGIMLAPKKVQEQYTSTKTTRQLSTHGLLEGESRSSRRGTQGLSFRDRDPREKERRRGQERSDRSKGKVSSMTKSKGKSKSKSKDKSEKGSRVRVAESTESSSAGSITNSAIKQVITAPEPPAVKIELAPSISSSTTFSNIEPSTRPDSPSSLLRPSVESAGALENETSSIPPIRVHRDSIDSDDRLPSRTTHAEAFSALDPNDIENLRAKANSRTNTESSFTFAGRFLRVFRGSSRTDEHPSLTQTTAFHPPWLTTAGREQQEENDRVLNDLSASFRDVGLLHTNPSRPKSASKRKSDQSILDRIPDDCLYMLLPLWPGETGTANVHAETSSTASFVTIPENRQYLLVYYVPFSEATGKNKKPEKKKAKHSHSSDSGVELDSKNIYLPEFRAVARVVTYDELRLSGVRVPSDGLAISGPEWEAIGYPANVPSREALNTVVCQCLGRESGFEFLEDGLVELGLCSREEYPSEVLEDIYGEDEPPPPKAALTPIGRAAIEMIWLGCLAITSFGST